MLESKWLLDKQCFECVLWLPAGQAYLHCNYTLYDTGNRYSDSHTEFFGTQVKYFINVDTILHH